MSIGLILVIIVVIALLGGFSGRLRGYGYGYVHRGAAIPGRQGVAIRVRSCEHRLDAQLAAGARDTRGDLAAIDNEDAADAQPGTRGSMDFELFI